MRIIYLTVILCLACFACNKKKTINKNSVQTLKLEDKEWHFSDYFDIDTIICLETNKECFIAKINRLIVKKSYIYILDKSANSVFKFTKDGKYISKINSLGKGPQEYLSISSIDVTDDAIYVVAWQADQKLMKYSLDLTFIEESELPITCGAIKVVKDGMYFYSGNSCNKQLSENDTYYNFCLLDATKKISWFDLPFNKSYCGRSNSYGVSGGNEFSSNINNGLFFTKPFDNHIYSVTESGLQPLYRVAFGLNTKEFNEYNTNRKELLKQYKETEAIKAIYNVNISSSFTYFNLYSTSSSRCIMLNNSVYKWKSSIDPMIGLNTSMIVGCPEEYEGVISNVSPEQIKYRCKKYPESIHPIIKQIDSRLKIEDNPILIFQKFKR